MIKFNLFITKNRQHMKKKLFQTCTLASYRLFLLSSFLLIFGLSAYTLHAQTLQWAKGISGPNLESCNSMVLDSDGNILATGHFKGTVDFDPGPATYNLTAIAKNMFILKLDALGNLLWVKQVGGATINDVCSGNAITLDIKGNIYITGSANYTSTIDFDPGPGIYNLSSGGVPVLKLDSSGNFIWAKIMAKSSSGGTSIVVDTVGNVYTTGSYLGTSDFDPNAGVYNLIAGSFDENGFVSKLDSSGNFVWAVSFGGQLWPEIGHSIKLDAAQDLILTGKFGDTTDFDPGNGVNNLISLGGSDVFILKLASNGSFIWAEKIGSTSTDIAYSVALDAQDNIYLTGIFNLVVDFDPGPGIYNITALGNSSSDGFVLKLNSGGGFVWAKSFGEPIDYVDMKTVALDALGNVYLSGNFGGTVDFDPGNNVFSLTSAGNDDPFICKLDASGNFSWAKNMGGPLSDRSLSLIIDNFGNIYVTGIFNGTANFDLPGSVLLTTTSASSDLFIARYSNFGVGVQNLLDSNKPILYPNPTDGEISIDLGAETPSVVVALTNMLGQEVSRKKYFNTSKINLTIEGEKGMYLVKISSDNQPVIFKVIKQ